MQTKEIYPFAYFGNKRIQIKDLTREFYIHRKDIDYNDEHLSAFILYNRFYFLILII